MELEEARLLQLSMLPKELPNLPNLDIAVYMQTATEVGGDYYDFKVGMDGTLTTIIGDATGHGMKAGTVVTITKSLFNSMASNENIIGTFDKISQVIKGMKFRQLAMCLLMMKIRGNRLSISSAAMPPALIYRAKNKSVDEILLQGMPLGTMKKFPYKKIEARLNSGDRILLYSDGLPELANDKDQMFGYDRIITEFQLVGEKEPEEIVEHLKNSASQWVNGKEPDDDVTFVVIKMK
jgi:serine phosphatase RsbU (regulator of sigma subunit)